MFGKLKGCFLALVLSLSVCGAARAEKTISVLTCGTGEELYSAFGHSALMVSDESSSGAVIYNFGMFDFDVPFFYLKFVRGDLDYFLDAETEKWFMYVYTEEGRSVVAQRLNLTPEQTERIIASLDDNMLPENRAYKYKFIADNCTTALRDLIVDNTECDKERLDELTGRSFRDYLNDHLTDMPWTRLGINFIMGARVDREATFYESMFLPETLEAGLARMQCKGGELVAPAQALNEVRSVEDDGAAGNYVMYAVFMAVLIFSIVNRAKVPALVFFYIAGFLGCILLFIASISQHQELTMNFNMLWCNPLFIVAAAVASCTRKRNKSRFTAFVSVCGVIGVCFLAMIAVWTFGVQAFDPVFGVVMAAAAAFMYRTAMALRY